jgi:hypothetical protein
LAACVLGLLLPGLGHALLGRLRKGGLFCACLLGMFGTGLLLQARLQPYLGLDDPLSVLRSGAQMAVGLPYLLARSFGCANGNITAVTHEYGNTFTEVAGLLNVLVVLDAYDVALGRRP